MLLAYWKKRAHHERVDMQECRDRYWVCFGNRIEERGKQRKGVRLFRFRGLDVQMSQTLCTFTLIGIIARTYPSLALCISLSCDQYVRSKTMCSTFEATVPSLAQTGG